MVHTSLNNMHLLFIMSFAIIIYVKVTNKLFKSESKKAILFYVICNGIFHSAVQISMCFAFIFVNAHHEKV